MKETEKLGSAQSPKKKSESVTRVSIQISSMLFQRCPRIPSMRISARSELLYMPESQQTIRDKHRHMNFKRIITRT